MRLHFAKKLLVIASAVCLGATAFAAPMTSYAATSTAAEQAVDQWFGDSVFVGDSVMQGFSSYSARHNKTWLGELKFLCAGNFSIYSGLNGGVQPMYQGKKVKVWDGLKQMEAKRVFIELGLNDINMNKPEVCVANYKKFVDQIVENNPDIDVNIISMTYTVAGVEQASVTNPKIREYNAKLQKLASDNGWGYVNLADALADGNGDLRKVYCSDNFVHQTDAAYAVWCTVLRKYAAQRLAVEYDEASPLSGVWVEADGGLKFKYSDGDFAEEGWRWIDDDSDGTAECYYFDSNELLLRDTTTPDGFHVDSKGRWIEKGGIKTESVQ